MQVRRVPSDLIPRRNRLLRRDVGRRALRVTPHQSNAASLFLRADHLHVRLDALRRLFSSLLRRVGLRVIAVRAVGVVDMGAAVQCLRV